jgi:putative ABC transport system permease protein
VSLARLIAAFIARRPLTWAFHALTLALGVAVVVSLALVDRSVQDRFRRDLAGVDLVIGAKGAPTQLILSALFQTDVPTGNIPLAAYESLAADPMVRTAVPVSLGDSVRGARIVGTTLAYAELYGAELGQGRWWGRPMEAVLGAQAAEALGAGLGGRIAGQHGLTGGEAHGQPYTVVGVLKPTGAVIDRLVLTDTASVWAVHDDHGNSEAASREVTAVLVRYRSPMAAVMLPTRIAAQPDLQAASPALEVARLTRLLGAGAEVLRTLGFALLALAALGFFIALFGAVNQRQRELALLRVLGARPSLLFRAIALEALALGLVGGAAGLALGRGAAAAAAQATARGGGPALVSPPLGMVDAAALFGAAALSLAAASIPAYIAGRLRPPEALKAA